MAVTTYMRRSGSRLEPTAEWCEEAIRGLPADDEYRVTITRDRSVKQNKLYWGLCAKVAKMLQAMGDEAATKEQVDVRFRVHVGLWELVPLPLRARQATGQPYGVATRSISFDKMDQAEFNRFMDRVTAFTLTEFLPHVPTREFRREIEAMLIKEKDAA